MNPPTCQVYRRLSRYGHRRTRARGHADHRRGIHRDGRRAAHGRRPVIVGVEQHQTGHPALMGQRPVDRRQAGGIVRPPAPAGRRRRNRLRCRASLLYDRLRSVTECAEPDIDAVERVVETSTDRIRVHCVRSGQIPETLVQVERAVRPSSPLLIRGLGVRVPGGAPVLSWATSQGNEVDL